MCVWLAPSHIYDYVHTKLKCMLKMVVDESEKVNIDLRKVRCLRMVFKLKCGGNLCIVQSLSHFPVRVLFIDVSLFCSVAYVY